MLKLTSIITNGYLDIYTIEHMSADGYSFICTVPAGTTHPYAMHTDKLSIFGKYEEPQKEEESTICE